MTLAKPINKYIDYIDAPEDTFEQYVEKALKYNFRCVFANLQEYETGRAMLEGSDIILAGAIDFPQGTMTLEEKLARFEDAAKRRVCEIALEAKPGFLKTSTGRSFGGAKLEDVRLMHEVLGDAVAIKAAGGIHNYDEACAFIEAGASALGASAGIAIVGGAPTDERR